MYDTHLQTLADWATADRFQSEVEAAREAFFERSGPIHEDDRSFETRMTALMEYYLLDRPLASDPEGRTPARLFLDEEGESLTTGDRTLFRGFTRTQAGVFEVRRIGAEGVRVRDMVDREKVDVAERRAMAGVSKGDIIQARLVPWGEKTLFGRAFVFHPREARKVITKAIKRRRKAGELDDAEGVADLRWQLMRTALVHERQQANNRVPPNVERIYGQL